MLRRGTVEVADHIHTKDCDFAEVGAARSSATLNVITVFINCMVYPRERYYIVEAPPECKGIQIGRRVSCAAGTRSGTVNPTVCGLPAALSLMLSAAVRLFVARGRKITLILQLVPASNDRPQLLVSSNSTELTPVIERGDVILKVLLPTFVSMTLFAALTLPLVMEPKFKLVGENFAVVPTPVRLMVCGLPAALSLTLRAAVRVPLAVGLNRT